VAARIIGVDIGTTQIRAAEVELSGRSGPGAPLGTLVSYSSIATPAGAVTDGEVLEVQTVASLLKQLWSKGKFSHKRVVIGVGNPRTVVREIEVPALPMDQVSTSLPFQVAEILPMPTDEALMDFYPTSYRNEEGRELFRGIMVASAKSSVANTILAVETAGLQPHGVDLNAFALHRALCIGDLGQQVVAFVDIGARVTTVVISAEGQPRLIRVLPTGGQDATDAVASAMQVPAAEAEQFKRAVGIATDVPPAQQLARDAVTQSTRQLVEGVRNTFVYFSGNNPGQGVQHVVLTGGGAYLPGLGQYLASAARLPVSFGNGLGAVRVNKGVAANVSGQDLFVPMVVGLALAEVQA
jgi:type IV pilus assembly protein PilM